MAKNKRPTELIALLMTYTYIVYSYRTGIFSIEKYYFFVMPCENYNFATVVAQSDSCVREHCDSCGRNKALSLLHLMQKPSF